MAKTKNEVVAADYETADRSARHIGDQLLRKYGFRIEARPKKGPVLWSREGHSYTEDEAKSVVRAESRKK